MSQTVYVCGSDAGIFKLSRVPSATTPRCWTYRISGSPLAIPFGYLTGTQLRAWVQALKGSGHGVERI